MLQQPVTAIPLASWQVNATTVTAIRLQNQSGQRITLDPRELQGQFTAAAFQHDWLGPRGLAEDTTVVYSVTEGPVSAPFAGAETMMPRQSLLLKILLPVVVLLTLWLLLPGQQNIAEKSPSRSVAALTPQELRDLGIDGDTPADTVATLVGQMKQYRRELQTIQNDNESQQDREKRLKAQQATLVSELRGICAGSRTRCATSY